MTVYSKATVAPIGVSLTGAAGPRGQPRPTGPTSPTSPRRRSPAPRRRASSCGSRRARPAGRVPPDRPGDGRGRQHVPHRGERPGRRRAHLRLSRDRPRAGLSPGARRPAGAVDVDTQAPRITVTTVNLAKGHRDAHRPGPRVRPRHDEALIPGQFTIVHTSKGRRTRRSRATAVSPTSLGSLLGPNTITLTFKKSHLPKGTDALSVAAGAIRDLAGNSLAAGVGAGRQGRVASPRPRQGVPSPPMSDCHEPLDRWRSWAGTVENRPARAHLRRTLTPATASTSTRPGRPAPRRSRRPAGSGTGGVGEVTPPSSSMIAGLST